MTRLTVHEYAAALRHRYRAARKGVKKRILDEFCQTTGMHRKAAIRLLNRPAHLRAVGRGRPRRYGPEVAAALAQLWKVGDRMCGKLLASVIPDLLAPLERHRELQVSPVVKRYDDPRTPYQRLLASGTLSEVSRAQLERQYLATNPAELQRRIDRLLRQLWRLGETMTNVPTAKTG